MNATRSQGAGALARPGLALILGLVALTVGMQQGQAADPIVVLRPTTREGPGVPSRFGWAINGGGEVSVVQPAPDTLVMTLNGVVAAKGNPIKPSSAELVADLTQQFEILFPQGFKPVQLGLEARVNGLLRSEGKSG